MLEYAELQGSGPPGEIRTPDTQVRSLVLYPAELRAEARSLGLSFEKVKKCRAVRPSQTR